MLFRSPGVPYTLSHRLIPIVREYRRASATAIDASLKPLMQRHLRQMEEDLREAGCRLVLVGHSERRQYYGESDALVAEKAARAAQAGLIPVVCLGESLEERESGATESVVGLLAIPVMLRHAYDRSLISGTICAGGSLGSIIPPSVLVVILSLIAEIGIGDMFAGMLLPGLILAAPAASIARVALMVQFASSLPRCAIRPRLPRIRAALRAESRGCCGS